MAVCLVFDIDDTIYVHTSTSVTTMDYTTPYHEITYDSTLHSLLQKISYPKFVLTNATYGHANLILDKMGVIDEFKKIYSRDNIPAMKPEPHCYYAVYQDIVTTVGSKPQIIFFDDMLDNLATAKQRGWYTVWISPHYSEASTYSFVNRGYATITEALQEFQI